MNSTPLVRHPFFVAFAIQAVIAYEWLVGGWSKLAKGVFVSTMGTTLDRFQQGNPHEWYVDSLLGIAKNSPALFGQLVQWGELFSGIGLIVALLVYGTSSHSLPKKLARSLAITALLGGAFMNANFYFAAGWTSPSTSGLNMMMFWIQVTLLLFWVFINKKET